MITSDKKSGRELARCTCDICGSETSIPAMHGNAPPGTRGSKQLTPPPLLSEGNVLKKLQALGWALVQRKLHCPVCEAGRKIIKDIPMTTANVSEIRQPTREQIREIVQALEIMYDDKAGRYTGGQTDATVAKEIGNGIMPGWVAFERERAFGPAGGNEEIDALVEEMSAYGVRLKLLEKAVSEELKGLEGAHKRIDAIKAAVGPKAARA